MCLSPVGLLVPVISSYVGYAILFSTNYVERQPTLDAIVHAYSRDPFRSTPVDEDNWEAKMRVARILVAVVATVIVALAVGGTAAADPPAMTFNSDAPGMTFNSLDMTFN
jgi:hypothetical protein